MYSNPIIVVFGRRGFGKTTWIRWHIYERPEKVFFIYDHHREYIFERAYYYNSVKDFLMENDSFEINDYSYNKVIFRGEIDYDEFFEMCYEVGNCIAVFDEIDNACNTAFMSKSLNKIIQYGRHKNVGLIGSARRPSRVVRDLTANASSIIIYNIQEPRDLKYIEEFCGEDFAEMAPWLDIGEYIHYPPDEESRKELLG